MKRGVALEVQELEGSQTMSKTVLSVVEAQVRNQIRQ